MGWFTAGFQSRVDGSSHTDFSVSIVVEPFVRDCNFVRAGCAAAESILRSRSGFVYVGVSGGQHSEYVVRRFCDVDSSRVVPLVISLPWNGEEVLQARRICQEIGVEPWVVEYLDRSWLYNRFQELSYSSGRVGYLSGVQWLLSECVSSQGGNLVTGSGHHFNMGLEPNLGLVQFVPELYFYEWDYYVQSFGHTGSFFTSSQQLFDSMLKNTDFTADVYASQCLLYRHQWRSKMELDLELFQQARSRWPWGQVRPRWRSVVQRQDLMVKFDLSQG